MTAAVPRRARPWPARSGPARPSGRPGPRATAFLAGLLAVGLLASSVGGCASFEDQRGSWNGGVITVATGPTTGGFYQVGGGYADAINRHIKGYEAVVAPTAGSADNLLRLGAGDANVALTFADVAVDALRGEGAFAGPPRRIRALAAPYRSYAHLVVRTDRNINKIEDLRGKQVSTGAKNSFTRNTTAKYPARRRRRSSRASGTPGPE